MLDLRMAKLVAAQNCHVRDMLELKRLADQHNITNPRIESNLESWTNEWLDRNPRQAQLFRRRLEQESRP